MMDELDRLLNPTVLRLLPQGAVVVDRAVDDQGGAWLVLPWVGGAQWAELRKSTVRLAAR